MILHDSNGKETIVYIHEDEFFIHQGFAGATHVLFDDPLSAIMFRKKAGDSIQYDKETYVIQSITDMDNVLYDYCLKHLIESGGVTLLQFNDLDPEKILSQLSEYLPENTMEIQYYQSYQDLNEMPLPINLLVAPTGKSYKEVFLNLVLDNETKFRNNPYHHKLNESNNILLTYSSILLLSILEIELELIALKTNLYITDSTNKEILNEFHKTYKYYDNESVLVLLKREGKLCPYSFSEEEKRSAIEFASKIKEVTKVFKTLVNNDDIKETKLGSPEFKSALGVFNYDCMAINLSEETETILVCDDFALSFIANGINDKYTTGVIELLIYLDLPIPKFLSCIERFKNHKFVEPFTSGCFIYLAERLTHHDEKPVDFKELFFKHLQLPDKSEYRDIYVYTIVKVWSELAEFSELNIEIEAIRSMLFDLFKEDYISKYMISDD